MPGPPRGRDRARDAPRAADRARHARQHHRARDRAADPGSGTADHGRRGGFRHRGRRGFHGSPRLARRPRPSRRPRHARRRRRGLRVSPDGLLGAVRNTPLMRLKRLSEETGCDIFGKAEFMNPGGSVKDRAGGAIVLEAERRGELAPGGTVVEGTAGNTGIGLAHVCNTRGYRCVIVMPDNQSPEKYALLRMLGAEVHAVPAVPYSNPQQYQKVSQRLAASLPNAIWSNQFDNTANRETHVRTTGPEIWAQTAGRIDAFVAAPGTGGTP